MLREILKARREYRKVTGMHPKKIRMSQKVYDQISEELENEGVLKYLVEANNFSMLYGMQIKIEENFPPDRVCEIYNDEDIQQG